MIIVGRVAHVVVAAAPLGPPGAGPVVRTGASYLMREAAMSAGGGAECAVAAVFINRDHVESTRPSRDLDESLPARAVTARAAGQGAGSGQQFWWRVYIAGN